MEAIYSNFERLKHKSFIDVLFREGKHYRSGVIRLIWIKASNEVLQSQAGFVVPKRNFRRAVDRNRIKRLMRESSRLHEIKENAPKYLMMFVYQGIRVPSYEETNKDVQKVLDHLYEN